VDPDVRLQRHLGWILAGVTVTSASWLILLARIDHGDLAWMPWFNHVFICSRGRGCQPVFPAAGTATRSAIIIEIAAAVFLVVAVWWLVATLRHQVDEVARTRTFRWTIVLGLCAAAAWALGTVAWLHGPLPVSTESIPRSLPTPTGAYLNGTFVSLSVGLSPWGGPTSLGFEAVSIAAAVFLVATTAAAVIVVRRIPFPAGKAVEGLKLSAVALLLVLAMLATVAVWWVYGGRSEDHEIGLSVSVWLPTCLMVLGTVVTSTGLAAGIRTAWSTRSRIIELTGPSVARLP
jgi:hypothetical protein